MWTPPASTLLLLGLSAACSPQGTQPGSQSPPSAHDYAGQAAEPDSISLDELEQGLDQVLAALALVDPDLVYDAHAAVIAEHGDDLCPELGDHNGQVRWSGDCTTADGVAFYGSSLSTEERNFPHDDGREVDELLWVSGTLRVLLPDGSEYDLMGDDLVLRVPPQQDGDPRTWESELVGEFHSSLPQHAGTLLSSDLLVQLRLVQASHEDGKALSLDGDLSWLDGPVVAASFDGLSLADRDVYCGLEPAGQVRLRARQGGWYELAYDGSNADGLRTPDCDGCGTAWYQGQDLGQVCADWHQLVAWETSPW